VPAPSSPEQTNAAIPLPYAGPFLPGNQQQSNYDVPVAPVSQAAAVGAPDESNTQAHCKSVGDFVGDRVVHSLRRPPHLTDDQLQARRDWLPDFLSHGGLNKLVALLKNLSQLHFTRTSPEAAQSSAKDKISKRCLAEVMEAIKVLLISSFCANENNRGLALELQRKMSSCSGTGAQNTELVDQNNAGAQGGSGGEKKGEAEAKKNKMQEE